MLKNIKEREREGIQKKIKTAEERLAVLENRRSIAMLTSSNWTTVGGKPVYIGIDGYDIDIELMKDYIYLLKEKIILNE